MQLLLEHRWSTFLTMAIYELKEDGIEELRATSFRIEGVNERQDLQRLLRNEIHVVDPNVMVLAEEFGRWDDSRRRIDLLALDRDARLVVIELKRTEDGGHMELQALRYAAMVSRMTFEQAVDAHDRWLAANGKEPRAERAILDFLGWSEPDEERFGQDVRIVLVSADFSKELTTSVLWLNERDLDVRCVRLKPYSDAGRVLVDVQQVIPLPEADEYVVQVREKERRERRSRESGRDSTRYDVTIERTLFERQFKRRAIHLVVKALCSKGATPEEISEVVSWRGGKLWRETEGAVSAEEFALRMETDARNGGPSWEPGRWHSGEDGLVRSNGRTWALTMQWGPRTGEAIDLLLTHWPDSGVEVRESDG
ncbi:hypothetical protein Pla163_02380 [Planctomycetes bacterium Pla163]|uniref:Endonuclease NucS n=1 Tax=Rohdeia mirabilis TaxID=2528008 RepID=A0A518CVA6_9BACT|nr:hypothetical protein Pla163_02380 [Planctomycetes bacterium Pla163]